MLEVLSLVASRVLCPSSPRSLVAFDRCDYRVLAAEVFSDGVDGEVVLDFRDGDANGVGVAGLGGSAFENCDLKVVGLEGLEDCWT